MIDPINIKHILLLAWVMGNAALVAGIGQELDWGEKMQRPLPTAKSYPADLVKVELMSDFLMPGPQAQFNETLKRPLFVPTRLEVPPPPPPPPPPKPAMKKGQFQLVGTIIVEDVRLAVLKETAGGKMRQFAEGQSVNGMKLASIKEDHVVLSQYDENEELRLKIQPSRMPQADPNSPVSVATQQSASTDRQPIRPSKNPRLRLRPQGQ